MTTISEHVITIAAIVGESIPEAAKGTAMML
jgi:hypothetical protein